MSSNQKLLIGGVGIAAAATAIGGVLLHVAGYQAKDAPGAVWFVTLLIVVIIALALAAAMFATLELSNREEAFALPSGSIRALLAVGIMTLLVVFGLHAMEADGKAEPRPDKPFASIEVPAGELQARTNEYVKQGLSAVVTTAGLADPDPAKARPAKVDLYSQVRVQAPNDAEISKQMMTAIITLLTTVVGFYFGSRSMSDGVKTGAASAGGAPGSDTLEGLTTERKTAGDTFATLQATQQTVADRLTRLSGHATLADAAAEASRQALQTQAQTALTAATAARAACDTALGAATKALGALTATPTAETLKAARAAVDEGKSKLDAYRTASASLAAAVDEVAKVIPA